MPLNIFLQINQECHSHKVLYYLNHKIQLGLLNMNTFCTLMHYKMLCSAFLGKKISCVTLAYEYYNNNSSFLFTCSELRQPSLQHLESPSVSLSYENAYSMFECPLKKPIWQVYNLYGYFGFCFIFQVGIRQNFSYVRFSKKS